MYPPSSPEASLRLQRVVIGTLWVAIAALVSMALGVLLGQQRLGWAPTMGMLGILGMFVLIFAAMLPPLMAGADDYRRHVSTQGTHHCQCRDCGRTFIPDPQSPLGRPHPIFIPQQRWTIFQAILNISPFAGLVVVVALIAAVILEFLQWSEENGSTAQFLGSDTIISVLVAALLFGVSGLLLLALVLGARVQRNRAAREIAIHSPQHGCTCAWCGRKNVPLFPNTTGNANPTF